MNENGEGKRHLALERAFRTISPAKRGCQKAQPSCYAADCTGKCNEAAALRLRQHRFPVVHQSEGGQQQEMGGRPLTPADVGHDCPQLLDYNLVGARLQCLRKGHKEGGGCHYHTYRAVSWQVGAM